MKIKQRIKQCWDCGNVPHCPYTEGFRTQPCELYRVPTVFDNLQRMDNAELAKWFFDHYHCHKHDTGCVDKDSEEVCVKCWVEFLNKKVGWI